LPVSELPVPELPVPLSPDDPLVPVVPLEPPVADNPAVLQLLGTSTEVPLHPALARSSAQLPTAPFSSLPASATTAWHSPVRVLSQLDGI
jgi:hypothetical protein